MSAKDWAALSEVRNLEDKCSMVSKIFLEVRPLTFYAERVRLRLSSWPLSWLPQLCTNKTYSNGCIMVVKRPD